MYAVATFLVVAVITVAFTKLATGALIATGVPPESAAFQARSAFSGAGFTTTEAENVVNHAARRRIIATTMFVGSLGTPTLVVSVLIGFLAPGPGSTTARTLVAISGLMAILLVIANRPMTRLMTRVGENLARRRLLPALSNRPDELLALGDGFVVASVAVTTDPGETSRSLRGLEAMMPGLHLLGVRRGSSFYGEKPVDIDLGEGDELVVSGRREQLAAFVADQVADDPNP